ncbi:LOW QUALITY PROTEIN: aurora kinase A- and ninein-interacting protein [Phascolarctos cinereus]|uniref:LOW QUALITY PROTEIN: aurora kinase A and ninein-interacting protein n=1 Tax=Phascolarctos cinereus TaxID=38626 RepID=A0A6P5K1J2_PHACI|nr:LOW QUALITY PROTEIN: aurora kinase A and ninein-interacting protein [Phascolarctos cinereus]
MRRRGPAEAEACGVWLDAAALKKRKVQTRLSNPITRMLPPARGEREAIVGFTQRRAQPVGTKQTLIASFFASKSGKANDGGQGRPAPGTASQRKKKQKRDVMLLDPLLGPRDECAQCPETAAAKVTKEPQELICSTPSPKKVSDCCREARPAVLSSQDQKLPLPQVDIAGSAEVGFAFTQHSKGLGVLAQGREGGKIHHKQGQETKGLVDRAELEKVLFSKENEQFSVLPQSHQGGKAGKGENREQPWRGGDTELVEQRPCSSQAFSWDGKRYDPDLKSRLFTEDSQGQRVIAHPPRAALQDIANFPRKPLHASLSSQVQCQGRSVLGTSQLNSQPDMLFTQDSQGNRVIKHCF